MHTKSTIILRILNERVLLIDTSGIIGLETLLHINETVLHTLDTVNAPLHIIYNDINVSGFGTDVSTLTRASVYLTHPNLGLCVCLRSTRLVAFMRRLTCKLLTTSMPHTVDTLDEAVRLLQQYDHTMRST